MSKTRLLFFVNIIVLIAAFVAGALFQHYLSSISKQTSNVQSDSKQVQVTDSTIKNNTQQAFIKFLDYLVKTGTPDMHLQSYKLRSLDSIYTKNKEIHAIFTFDAMPKDASSSQKLIIGGGAPQKDGSINENKGYIILINQNGTYSTKEVSFSPPTNF